MSFSHNVSGLRQVQDYAKAVEIEAVIVPIRGRSPECKPLDVKRTKRCVTIRREGEDVVIKAYNTDVLTYKPDGEIVVNTGGYSTVGTADIIGRVLGMHVRAYGNELWIKLKAPRPTAQMLHTLFERLGDTPRSPQAQLPKMRAGKSPINIMDEYTVAGWYMLGRGTRLVRGEVLSPIHGEVLNPIHTQVRQLNRKKTKVIREKYRPFMDYARGMCKLLVVDGSIAVQMDEYTVDGMVPSMYSPLLRHLCDFEDIWNLITCGEGADRLENFAHALQILMELTSANTWVYSGTNGDPLPYRTTFVAMQRYITKMVYKMHASDVLDTNTLPLGQLGRDKYAGW